MTMTTPSYLGETIEYSSLHACRSTLEDPTYHLEIFDDFFRLPTNEKTEGMGLGLAIARRLVLGMGGKVWVESDPSAGCKFSFIVPLNPLVADSEGKK